MYRNGTIDRIAIVIMSFTHSNEYRYVYEVMKNE